MFYEEKIINGKLMCRGIPGGVWEEVGNAVLVERIRALQYALDIAHSRILTFDVMEQRGAENIPSQQDILPKLEHALRNNRVH